MIFDPTIERLMQKMASSKEEPMNRAICAAILQSLFEQYDHTLRQFANGEVHANALLATAQIVAENHNV